MSIASKQIIVTGGAGFIGSHLVDKLIELDARVAVIDNLSFGKAENINKKADFINQDITEYKNYSDLLKDMNPDIIYHLAANATTKESAMGWNDPVADYRINTLGTLNTLQAIVDTKTRPILVYASSAAVYGEPEYVPTDEKHPTSPVSPYGISKLTSEKYIQAYGKQYSVPYVILRFFPVYGPRQPRYVIFDLLMKLRKHPEVLEILGTGKQTRDFTYVEDLINAIILVTTSKDAVNQIFNTASSESISIQELAKQILNVLNIEETTKLHFTGQSWAGDIQKWVADTTKIQKLGYKHVTQLKEGIRKLNDWLELSNK
jgi:UDP-glucose 4-epimerase